MLSFHLLMFTSFGDNNQEKNYFIVTSLVAICHNILSFFFNHSIDKKKVIKLFPINKMFNETHKHHQSIKLLLDGTDLYALVRNYLIKKTLGLAFDKKSNEKKCYVL